MLKSVPVKLPTAALIGGLSIGLSGCASLPASGPTSGQIVAGTKPSENVLGFQIKDVDGSVIDQVAANEGRAEGRLPKLASLTRPGANDVLGPGDVLEISVYEVGVGLFGGGRVAAAPNVYDPSAHAELFPDIVVDRGGNIALPYIGVLNVGGKTPTEVQAMIARGYRGKSQDPQVLVGVKTNVSETVYVSGDVRKTGVVLLTLKRERILDVIATAGGTTTASEDTVIRFTRGGQSIEERFDHIRDNAADNLVLNPGDQIEVIQRPRTFLVLGATGKVSQISFETSQVSLAEALARVGGPSDTTANAAAIYVFRYEPAEAEGGPDVPMVYRLNFLQPASYFLSQKFAIRDKDIVYISNAWANKPAKAVGILNELLSPFISARAVSR